VPVPKNKRKDDKEHCKSPKNNHKKSVSPVDVHELADIPPTPVDHLTQISALSNNAPPISQMEKT
jgi:hypothetical protein